MLKVGSFRLYVGQRPGDIRRRETRLGAAVIEDEGEFLRVQLGIYRYSGETRMPDGIEDFQVERIVLHCQRDPVARHQVELTQQGRGKPGHPVAELGVGPADPLPVGNRRPITMDSRDLRQ